jgi:hypothetical protein
VEGGALDDPGPARGFDAVAVVGVGREGVLAQGAGWRGGVDDLENACGC